MIIPSCKVMFLFLLCHWILKLWAFYLPDLIRFLVLRDPWHDRYESISVPWCSSVHLLYASCPFGIRFSQKSKYLPSLNALTFWKLQTWWFFFCGATCCGNCDNMYAVQILLFVGYKDLTVTLFLLIILAWELHNILHKKCSFLSLENTPGFWKLFMVS